MQEGNRGIQHRIKFLAAAIVCLSTSQLVAPGQVPAEHPAGQPSPETLNLRREGLERQVQTIESKNGVVETPQLRSLREQLLQATGEEDAALQEVPKGSKGLFGTASLISMPVFYITDRARISGGSFGGELRDQGVAYGKSVVTLDTDYGVRIDMIAGARNLPPGNGTSSPVLQNLDGMQSLLDSIGPNTTDPQGRRRRVLLFVHGYNVTFNDALTATARISSEVQFPVIPVAYSWPSDGSYVGYWHDEDNVRGSSRRFMSFLEEFLKKSPTEVIIVCHSMGAREVTSALAELGRHGSRFPALQKIIFAAADISSKEFLDEWPYLQKLEGVQFGFYASDHDLALRLSHVVHRLPRLGDASPIITAPVGGTTVDASAVDPVYQAAGHSYILNSPKIGADLGAWIDGNTPPANRGLVQVVRAGQTYFIFP